MKLNKILIAAAAFGLAANAFAAPPVDQGHGKINFKGSIIDAPCSLENTDIEINFDQVANTTLANGGKSSTRDINIELTKCDIATLKTVTTHFSGPQSKYNPELLGISGVARGAGIAIVDSQGDLVDLSQGTTAKNFSQTLKAGSNTLTFTAYLQGETADPSAADQPTIVPGEFTATANYALTYQ